MFTPVFLNRGMTFLIQLHVQYLGFIKRENSHIFKTYGRHSVNLVNTTWSL